MCIYDQDSKPYAPPVEENPDVNRRLEVAEALCTGTKLDDFMTDPLKSWQRGSFVLIYKAKLRMILCSFENSIVCLRPGFNDPAVIDMLSSFRDILFPADITSISRLRLSPSRTFIENGKIDELKNFETNLFAMVTEILASAIVQLEMRS